MAAVTGELGSITTDAVSIVIPVYNAIGQIEGLLIRLKHFVAKYGASYQVIIADDASTDGTAEELKREFPFIELVKGERNVGFAGNVNRGAKAAHHSFIAVVNSDIELIGNPFKPLISVLRNNQDIFATMPLVYNRKFGKVENLQRLIASRGLAWNTDLPEEAEWSPLLESLITRASTVKDRLKDVGGKLPPIRSLLCGAFFVCKRSQFEQLGGFSERFQPFYWEDVDLDYRARRKGLHCAVIPSTAVVHRHSESIDRFRAGRKIQYLRLNQLRFVIDHQRQLDGLVQPHIWWGLRSLKELLAGNRVMASAYWRAGLGQRDI